MVIYTKLLTVPYEKLVETKHYKHFLPDTAKLSKAALDLFINQYNKVIVKPIDLSRGRGIFKIERQGSQLLIRDTIDHDFPVKKLIETRELESYLLNKGIDHERYIIQPYLDLAKIDQNPWDIRIIMQKNEEFKWRCNGIECRLAGSNQYITNISRGGRALTIHDALTLAFGANVDAANIKKKLIEISKEFCEILDDNNEHFAEFGLDFAIDCDLNYWFIEANVRPTFNGFKKMDKKNYLHICSAPILYATALSGFNRRKKHVTKS